MTDTTSREAAKAEMSDAELAAALRNAVERCCERMGGKMGVRFFSIPADPRNDIDLLMSEAARRIEAIGSPSPAPTLQAGTIQEWTVKDLTEFLRDWFSSHDTEDGIIIDPAAIAEAILDERFTPKAQESVPAVAGGVELTGPPHEVDMVLEGIPSIYDSDPLYQRKTFLGNHEYEELSFTIGDLKATISALRDRAAGPAITPPEVTREAVTWEELDTCLKALIELRDAAARWSRGEGHPNNMTNDAMAWRVKKAIEQGQAIITRRSQPQTMKSE
jgi:hypothetical protein